MHDVDSDAMVKSRVRFVDLAGSERISKSQSVGDRFKVGTAVAVVFGTAFCLRCLWHQFAFLLC